MTFNCQEKLRKFKAKVQRRIVDPKRPDGKYRRIKNHEIEELPKHI